jgi:hypothetical protein
MLAAVPVGLNAGFVGGFAGAFKQNRMDKMRAPAKLTLSAALLIIAALPAVAMGARPNDRDHYRGAPGPIAGAGLPILAVGYGAYWLVRRYRRKPE